MIIFAKAPIPGQVKTRLCPPLTEDEAATLHGSLVLDVIERTRAARVDRFLACAPSADHVFFKIMEERHGLRLLTQRRDADLGGRMREAFRAVFELGYRQGVLLGTDVPTVSSALVAEALALLATHDVVLGPALDGGYYLIGLNWLVPELFTEVPWSTDHVCAVTEEKARALGLTVGLLPRHRDLDTVDDVLAVASEVSRERRPTLGPRAMSLSRRTENVLRSLTDRIRSRSAEP